MADMGYDEGGTSSGPSLDGALLSANNLSDVASVSASRASLGLGSAATHAATDFQSADAELLAIAGLTSAANKAPYFTGSGTAALADLTAAGRALIDDADAAAQRTTLGLAIGTNVQAFDADLAALAGLTSAADKVPYFTGSGAAATADFTAAGRALVDDADAAAQRTTLGLGTISTHDTGDFQAADADLTAIAALTSAANKLAYYTGAGTAALADFTAAGRALVDDADASAQRTTLGLGTAAVSAATDFQPVDPDLTAIAGLTSAADKVPYFTGSSTAALATLTAAGRALIDDADAAAQRTTLGLGTISTHDTGDFQAADTELSALAGLTSAANKLPYFTGSGTAATTDLTAAGRALIDDADAAAQRATLGLGTAATSASTDFQPADADLTALAGLTSAADKVPYFTGSGTAATADFTAAGRALVDDADASAQRTTLGLGTLATQSGTFSGTSSGTNTGDQTLDGILGTSSTIAAATTTDLSTVSGNLITVTMSGDTTTTSLGTAPSGIRKTCKVSGGAWTLQHSSALLVPGAASVQLPSGSLVEVESLGSGNWQLLAINNANTGYIQNGAGIPGLHAGGVNALGVFSTQLQANVWFKMIAARWSGAKGADVASAATVTLGSDGNMFALTGTTPVTAITTTNWIAGSKVTLIPASAAITFGHNTGAGGIKTKTGASITPVAGGLYSLEYDGTNWLLENNEESPIYLARLLGSEIGVAGSNLTDADATLTVAGGNDYAIPPATLTANRAATMGVTGSPFDGEIISVRRRGTEAFTYTLKDDTGTAIFIMPASTKLAADCRYNATSGHFEYSGCKRIQ